MKQWLLLCISVPLIAMDLPEIDIEQMQDIRVEYRYDSCSYYGYCPVTHYHIIICHQFIHNLRYQICLIDTFGTIYERSDRQDLAKRLIRRKSELDAVHNLSVEIDQMNLTE